MALSFIEPELWVIKVYISGISIYDIFRSCDLDLDPEMFPYSLELHQMYKYEIYMLRLWQVIVQQTNRQTESTEVINDAASSWAVENTTMAVTVTGRQCETI